MDRQLVWPGQVPQDLDILKTNRFGMVGLGAALQAILGPGPYVEGLACSPGSGLAVSIGQGAIYQLESIDATAYGALAADTTDQIIKQGLVFGTTSLALAAPATAGQSVVWLIEAQFQEVDNGTLTLPYYNSANPAQALSAANPSQRQAICALQAIEGTPATTGTQTAPTVDAGWTALYTVTVAYGQSSISAGNIAQVAGAPFLQAQLSGFQTIAGNPNGVLGGTAGIAGVQFPTMVWDTTHNILWVCTTTGTPTTAVWTSAGASGGTPPFWCGTSAGTANAQTITTPVAMLALSTGTAVAFEIGAGLTNTGPTTLTVGTFGTFALRKDGPTGPIALAGGELVAGNIVSARFDGTYLQLSETEMGTAALANASSNTGTVAAVSGSGSITPGHLVTFADAGGTVQDGGLPTAAAAATYINSSQTIGPGSYLVDTSAGTITLMLPSTPILGTNVEFIDAGGTWATNNLTVAHNGHTIMGLAADLICNISGEVFRLWFNASNDWRIE